MSQHSQAITLRWSTGLHLLTCRLAQLSLFVLVATLFPGVAPALPRVDPYEKPREPHLALERERSQAGEATTIDLPGDSNVAATAARKERPPAREQRLAVGLGLGLGWTPLGQFNPGVQDWMDLVREQTTNDPFDRPLGSNLALQGEVSVRYYFRFNLLGQIGIGTLYNRSSTKVTLGGLSGSTGYDNLSLEISLMVGAYTTLWDRLYLYGGVGPSVLFLNRSIWFFDLGRVSSLSASRGGGVGGMFGVDVMVHDRISVGVETRLRYLRTSTLEPTGPSFDPLQPVRELDFSGVGALLTTRYFIW